MSVKAAALAEDSRFGKIVFPLFSRIAVGSKSLISLLNVANLVLGERDVVTRGRGSERPERSAYSSSRDAWASAVSASRDSSYL